MCVGAHVRQAPTRLNTASACWPAIPATHHTHHSHILVSTHMCIMLACATHLRKRQHTSAYIIDAPIYTHVMCAHMYPCVANMRETRDHSHVFSVGCGLWGSGCIRTHGAHGRPKNVPDAQICGLCMSGRWLAACRHAGRLVDERARPADRYATTARFYALHNRCERTRGRVCVCGAVCSIRSPVDGVWFIPPNTWPAGISTRMRPAR